MLIGAHNSIAGGLHNAPVEATKVGGDTMQIFCKNQRQWNAKPITDEEVTLFRDAVATAGLERIMVHDSYLINMGNPDPAKRENAFQAFMAELERCEPLGISYLNFHPGSHMHTSKKMRDDPEVRRTCLDLIADNMTRAIEESKGYHIKLVIENAAGQGTNVGMSWEEVGYLADTVDRPDRVGVCVDTQHSWASGYDWVDDYDGVWDAFDTHVGLNRLVAFHLNDSKEDKGARVDRHEALGQGKLGEGFWETLMQDPRFADRCGYLETPGGVEGWTKELAYLRALMTRT